MDLFYEPRIYADVLHEPRIYADVLYEPRILADLLFGPRIYADPGARPIIAGRVIQASPRKSAARPNDPR
jgi:hypothetical protein